MRPFSIVGQAVRAVLLVCLLVTSAARANDAGIVRADELIAALRASDFDQAARLFHYPETYTAAELAKDQHDVARHLRRLIQELGTIESLQRCARKNGVFVDLSMSGGDDPYWQSHPALNIFDDLTYCAKVTHDGEGFFVVSVVRVDQGWEVRQFTYQLPASAATAAPLNDLVHKVFLRPSIGKDV